MIDPAIQKARWTPSEEARLVEMWRSHSAATIANVLGRSLLSVKGKIFYLGLGAKIDTPPKDVMSILLSTGSLLSLRRFAGKIEVRDDGCWHWTGATTFGYPQTSINGRHVRLNRVAYEIRYGVLPRGMFACHRCDNPSCVNPDHLFAGTPKDNMLDKERKGRGRPGRPSGESNGRSQLTEKHISTIRLDTRSSRLIAKEYGVGATAIQRIKNRRSWGHLP